MAKKTNRTASPKKATQARKKRAGGKQPMDKKPAKKKMSQLDAAVKVLEQAKEPMNCKQMVEAMQKKGKESRFKKVDRGPFALNR